MIVRSISLYIAICIIVVSGHTQEYNSISRKELSDKISGYWIGQLAGNYIGFPFENLYVEDPIPVFVDRYMNYKDASDLGLKMNLNDRRAFIDIMADAMGGSWSDDDTDIEFVTLYGLEKYGLDIDYEEIKQLRMEHITRFIWSSNARVKELIEQGYSPPETGSRKLNQHWYTLGAQLTNEIWGVIYPGMVDQAAIRAEWAARVTHDSWATHGTVLFISMYSAAFFESDIGKLLNIGMAQMPPDSPYLAAVREVVKWCEENKDWRVTRQLIHENYYLEFDGFEFPFPLGSAVINGLNGIMALLYGQGDFIKTVGIATTTGYDCDNQAATVGGLLGVILGKDGIPSELTKDMPSRGKWEEPFNNTYINYSRDGLPNFNTITGIVDRIVNVTEKAILENDGRKEIVKGEEIYYIRKR